MAIKRVNGPYWKVVVFSSISPSERNSRVKEKIIVDTETFLTWVLEAIDRNRALDRSNPMTDLNQQGNYNFACKAVPSD